MATDVTHQLCESTWHGYRCGIVGKHKNHQAVKNGKTVAMWSDEVGSKDEPAEQD